MFCLLIFLAFMSCLHIKDVNFTFVVLQVFSSWSFTSFRIQSMTIFYRGVLRFCLFNQFIVFFSVPLFSSLSRGKDLLLALLCALSVIVASFLFVQQSLCWVGKRFLTVSLVSSDRLQALGAHSFCPPSFCFFAALWSWVKYGNPLKRQFLHL